MIDLDAPDLRLDARLSPAKAIPQAALDPGRGTYTSSRKPRLGPWVYDSLLSYLSASDQWSLPRSAARWWRCAIGKLFKREGHARWSTYLRTFAPMTQRWCQEEMKRERRLADLPWLAAAFGEGRLNKSRARAILAVVTPETERICRRATKSRGRAWRGSR